MLQAIVEQLEACNFQCEAGPLVNNQAFVQLKMLAQKESVAATTDLQKTFNVSRFVYKLLLLAVEFASQVDVHDDVYKAIAPDFDSKTIKKWLRTY